MEERLSGSDEFIEIKERKKNQNKSKGFSLLLKLGISISVVLFLCFILIPGALDKSNSFAETNSMVKPRGPEEEFETYVYDEQYRGYMIKSSKVNEKEYEIKLYRDKNNFTVVAENLKIQADEIKVKEISTKEFMMFTKLDGKTKVLNYYVKDGKLVNYEEVFRSYVYDIENKSYMVKSAKLKDKEILLRMYDGKDFKLVNEIKLKADEIVQVLGESTKEFKVTTKLNGKTQNTNYIVRNEKLVEKK